MLRRFAYGRGVGTARFVSSAGRVVLNATVFSMCSAMVLSTTACDEPKAPEPLKNAELKLESPSPTPADSPDKDSEKVPTFEIDESSAKVGYSRYLIDRADGLAKLRSELEAQKAHIDGKELKVVIARKAKLPWVTTYLASLEAMGARAFEVETPTRADYPNHVRFTATKQVEGLPACTPVSVIQEDRTTVTWKLGGGSQSRRGRGLGGPDLSTTGLSIERLAKACPKGKTVVVGAHQAVTWGLLYDLAASTSRIEDTSFEQRVLLLQDPQPGKRVDI